MEVTWIVKVNNLICGYSEIYTFPLVNKGTKKRDLKLYRLKNLINCKQIYLSFSEDFFTNQ